MTLSRAHFRTLPLRWIIVPALDAPELVFRTVDTIKRQSLYDDLREQASRWPRARSSEARKRTAVAIRRDWERLVALSIGYRFRSTLYGYYDFCEDAREV